MLIIYLINKKCLWFFKKYLFLFIFDRSGSCCCVQAFSCYGGQELLFTQCMGFSLWWLLLLQSVGSRRTGFSTCGMRLSSCGAWASLPHSIWDLPAPGIKPTSPALVGGFLATGPPGKPSF